MNTRWIVAAAALTFVTLVACGEDEPSGASQSAAGSGGSGGMSAGTGGGTAGTAAGAGTAGTGGESADAAAGSGGTGGGGFVCDPPADPGSFYALEAQSLDRFDPVSMCEFRGKVVLVVNIAAKCGYTPQLGGLADLQTEYLDDGLVVLGFYCNQFMNQAGDEDERLVCQENYGVNFEVFDIINVNPPDEHPIFTWLKGQEGFDGDVKWNFEKFLISRDGVLLERWATAVEPNAPQVVGAIEEALAQQ